MGMCPLFCFIHSCIFAKSILMHDKDHNKRIGERIRSYCAWRERCTKEVEHKLRELGTPAHMTEGLIRELREEGFLDDRRFAGIFASGKFSGNKWGKVRIRAELARRNIDEETIKHALGEIDNEDYTRVLKKLIENKQKELKHKKGGRIKEKIAAYCIQKGYEAALVWEILSETEQ